ncbi:serine/threonine protein kinase with TPR repeats [Trichormus variabilis ATCC 29413]|uniref:Serine/threonine protein kinase with TPR repeats n=4 Tax=Anabaena variabilis TaxID=264691 RepID=Q3MCW1_TRIV2|nr:MULTISPECIES: serine/threonine-protein kinase [Nostocaceae]ABA21175.1 serine/threonine protein kinase with TPR repeats [Trichormus variabilis ATCC 29413]MBC1213791.1 tetratricopeptide repeat protein [Trichormus variabilis ARAD]MBC1266964.1 tetratricopeptide repeat protein [Trichormus variabilis FSR]MBC1301486.1 tetratricopeptide repeat protein [Trichormus variabilis N2B]MBC1311601.1 tetratricopeptide repeat protein [Trichormus variabilis PNB]
MLGNTLVGRYQIISHLGGGGFGETFVACDTHLPGMPKCVVKKLQPQANDQATLEIARRLFDTEAQVLYKLGSCDRIPQLLAYFEENAEFYLVQEFIPGHDLSKELTPGKVFTQDEVTILLQEILTILEFVHEQNVIHRDINPRNLLRRQDGKLILIDFGAVKQITTQIVTPTGENKSTVIIGTPGYIPGEQAQGNPKFSSDIYAVGIVAIQALTGLLPHQLEHDADTHEIIWQNHAQVSSEFARFIDKMVCYDFRQRYASATTALQALTELTKPASDTIAITPTLPPTKFRFNHTKKSIFIKLLLAILLISATGTASVFVVNSINSNNATELAKQGNTFFELQRYKDALSAYKKAVDIRPDYAPAWYGKGKTLFRLKQYQDALTAYDKAIQIQPDYVEAWSGRGFSLQSLQRYAEAIASFDKALQLNENYPEVWNARGEAFSNLKQYDRAIKSYDKAIEFKSDAYESFYNKGLALQSLKEYNEAINAYNKAIEIKSDYERAWYNLGNSLVNLNRYEDAFKAYDKAVQYKTDYAIAWLSKGNVLIILRRYPEAIESFNQVIKFNPNSYQAWYGKGWSQHQNQRYAEAIESYKKAATIKPSNYQVWYSLGNSQYILQQYQEAIASYNKAVRYQPKHIESWYSRGNALFSLKQYQDAIASYEQAIKHKPDYSQAINARDEAQRQLQAATPKPVVIPVMPTPEFTNPSQED